MIMSISKLWIMHTQRDEKEHFKDIEHSKINDSIHEYRFERKENLKF
jgi:hypothetical protein